MALQTLFMPGIAQGRLTLASGTPVTITDQTAKTTIYFTPYKGNLISLYDGANWAIIPFIEASVAIPSTLFRCFDVFGYLNSEALAIETVNWNQTTGSITGATNATPIVITSTSHGLSVGDVVGIAGLGGNTSANGRYFSISTVGSADTFTIWSSVGNGAYTSGGTWYKINNSRATALVTTTGGVYTKTGDPTRLYLGTGCTTGTSGQCEDSVTNRLAVNYWNAVPRSMMLNPGYVNGNDFTFYDVASTSFLGANAGVGSVGGYVTVGETPAIFTVTGMVFNGGGASKLGIGNDSTSQAFSQTNAATTASSNTMATSATFTNAAGFHFAGLLCAVSAGTGSFAADNTRAGGTADPRCTMLAGTILG